MSDMWREFFNRNRAAFDDRDVPPGAWPRVEARLRPWYGRLWQATPVWRAAAVILLAALVYQQWQPTPGPARQAELVREEVADIDRFYSNQFLEKVSLIDRLDGDGFDQFTRDLERLEAMYQVLLEEMRKNPSRQVKDAIVLNWLIRLDLLNRQIQKLEEGRKRERGAESI